MQVPDTLPLAFKKKQSQKNGSQNNRQVPTIIMIRQVFIVGRKICSPSDQNLLSYEVYSGRFSGILLFEFFYSSGCIDEPLFPCQEGMALGTDLYFDVFPG
jgi:hypothetical protein